jgi:hypothetical protein
MKKAFILVLVFFGVVLAGSQVAYTAPNYVCTTPTVGGTYGNVTVPAGAHCSLDGTRVLGSVTVGTGASLDTSNNSGDTTVAGNVTGKNCSYIDMESPSNSHRTAVGGDLTITNCSDGAFNGARGGVAAGPPPNMLIGGKVNCSGNPSGCVFDYSVIGKDLTCNGNFDCDLQSDAVGGNVTINNSTSSFFVFNSIIGGNLACAGNAGPAGANNTVAGTKSGQCAAF